MKPNPGSKEAQKQGCICPVIDNHYGKGFDMGESDPSFWIVAGCPLHDESKSNPLSEEVK